MFRATLFKRITAAALAALLVLPCTACSGPAPAASESAPSSRNLTASSGGVEAPSDTEASVESTGSEDTAQSGPSAEPDASLDYGLEQGAWPRLAHVSTPYMNAWEDGSAVYFLPRGVTEGVPAGIYRLGKNDAMLDVALSPVNPDTSEPLAVESFTLLGGDLYFCILIGGDQYAYFRAPAAGGEVEFLFLQQFSYLVPMSGSLYFLFGAQNALGVYKPGTDSEPRLLPMEVTSGWKLQSQFLVVDGYVYYGEYMERTASYYRLDLSGNKRELLLDAQSLGEYMVNPVWLEGAAYYVQRDVETGLDAWMRLLPGRTTPELLFQESQADGSLMFAAALDEHWLFQDGERYYISLQSTPTDTSTKASNPTSPFAVSAQWFFFSDRAVPMDERAEPVSFESAQPPVSSTFDDAWRQAVAQAASSND